MMYGAFWGGTTSSSWVWIHVHWVFWAIGLLSFIAAVIWLAKFAKKQDLEKVIWIAALIGILGGLITVPFSIRGWHDMINGIGNRHEYMMGDDAEEFMDRMMGEYSNDK